MYSITDIKKGTIIQIDGTPFKVVEYNHSSMGRGGAIVRTKLKNLLDGSVQSKTFKGSDKIEPAELESKNMQFLYRDDEGAHFMDSQTYEQVRLSPDILTGQLEYLLEGMEASVLYFNDRPISVELPTNVAYQVVAADPGIKGDTAGSTLKGCEIETGLRVQVPLFIKVGDSIRVDTRDGSYVERA